MSHNGIPQIKYLLNILSPVPCIKTVIKKVIKDTKPTMELTSGPYINEIEAKENRKKNLDYAAQ
ncbi:hypothetical protein HHI36_017351, partial [Cryptolaemus montrouzieri]